MQRLEGLDGSSFLGFLAAMGCLSLLDSHAIRHGTKRPKLCFEDDFIARLDTGLDTRGIAQCLIAEIFSQGWTFVALEGPKGKTWSKPTDITQKALATLQDDTEAARWLAGWVCSFGGKDDEFDDTTKETTLSAMNGGSAQNLLTSMRDILSLVEVEHIERAIGGVWQRNYVKDESVSHIGTRKPTLRLDSMDDRPHAFRLHKPDSPEGKREFRCELGALALAVFAFPLFPVVPAGRQQLTLCSKRQDGRRINFLWSLWRPMADIDAIRSHLAAGVDDPGAKVRGAFAAFQAARLNIGQTYSFSAAEGLW